MTSGLGFQSSDVEEHKGTPRKKTISTGLIISFVLLVLVGLTIFGMNIYNDKLKKELTGLQQQTQHTYSQISTALSDETADFVVRSVAMDKEIDKNYESNIILGEIEKIMILKSSDGSGLRTVLKSFQYNAGSKSTKPVATGETTITSSGTVTITADADNFDVMAQQIDAFKNSELFDNVEVGSTDREDTGRIIFTLTMNVVGGGVIPYESDNVSISNTEENIDSEIEEKIETPNTEEMNTAEPVNVENSDNVVTEELPNDGNINVVE
jgi:hypothetical protein